MKTNSLFTPFSFSHSTRSHVCVSISLHCFISSKYIFMYTYMDSREVDLQFTHKTLTKMKVWGRGVYVRTQTGNCVCQRACIQRKREKMKSFPAISPFVITLHAGPAPHQVQWVTVGPSVAGTRRRTRRRASARPTGAAPAPSLWATWASTCSQSSHREWTKRSL